jgi:cellulose synthase/poly-beta-1,6-N-acetylglucosamine synthase-like glycosyltransferase
VILAEVAVSIFWLCVSVVLYTYVGYPIAVYIFAAIFGRRVEPPPPSREAPLVSVLIAAHNEEDVIGERIRNALALEYPHDRLEIVVASDGSSDRTVDIARRVGGARIRTLDFPGQRGKAEMLNEVIPRLRGEIVILSDANTSMDSTAVVRFVTRFGDQRVGVVVGRLVLSDPVTGRNVDSL